MCRGGRALARCRHNLKAADLSEARWRQRWQAERWFMCADGEAGKAWGNETIRWNPNKGWLEVKLPEVLGQLSGQVAFPIGMTRWPPRPPAGRSATT